MFTVIKYNLNNIEYVDVRMTCEVSLTLNKFMNDKRITMIEIIGRYDTFEKARNVQSELRGK